MQCDLESFLMEFADLIFNLVDSWICAESLYFFQLYSLDKQYKFCSRVVKNFLASRAVNQLLQGSFSAVNLADGEDTLNHGDLFFCGWLFANMLCISREMWRKPCIGIGLNKRKYLGDARTEPSTPCNGGALPTELIAREKKCLSGCCSDQGSRGGIGAIFDLRPTVIHALR